MSDDGRVDVSIVIVSYNTRELTIECIESIYAQTKYNFEIIIVDNSSSDGSVEAIEKKFYQDVRLMPQCENLGFARGVNIGAAAARAPMLLLLNPDTEVLDGGIDRLLDFAAQNPDARIWGGRNIEPSGAVDPTSCYARMTLWGLVCRVLGLDRRFQASSFFNPELYGAWQRDSVRRVDIVTGCFLLIDSAMWRMLGGFDEAFFMYGEEADLCLRAKRFGAAPLVTPNAAVMHVGAASERVHADKMVRLLKGKMTIVRRHFDALRRPFAIWLFTAWPWSRAVATRLSGRSDSDWSQIWARRREWWSGYGARP